MRGLAVEPNRLCAPVGPMSDISERIDAVMKAHFGPSLRQLGFKKKGRNFRRRLSDATQIVNVQASQRNSGGQGQFTLNLGIYFPAAAKFVGRYEELDEPTELDCPIRRRIGLLMPLHQDTWWSINPNTELDALSREVTDTLVRYGLPWFEQASRLESAVLDDDPHAGPTTKAALLMAMGNREAAVQAMTRALEHSDRAAAGWFAFASAAGLEHEYHAARARINA